MVGNAIHWIMQYMGVPNTYSLESDLFGGWRYPSFKQPVPEKDTEAVTSFNNTILKPFDDVECPYKTAH